MIDQMAAWIFTAMKRESKAAAEPSANKATMPLLTVKEAAKRLKRCEKTVLKHIRDARLNATNEGSSARPAYRVTEADLATYINANKLR